MMRASKENAAECRNRLMALKEKLLMERRVNLQSIAAIADFVEAAYYELPSEAEYDREKAAYEREKGRKQLKEKRVSERSKEKSPLVEGWL